MSKFGSLAFRYLFQAGDYMRLRKMKQDLSDLSINSDIRYLPGKDRGHLFDVIKLNDNPADAPLFINVHGGGLFASYKEVNANFNYEMARMGFNVVTISYRRVPDVKLIDQIGDVMAALSYINDNAKELGISTENVYISGDSAGALLAFFAMSINNSRELQKAFEIAPTGLVFKAAAFISIMLDTQRKDIMMVLNDVVTDDEDKGKEYEKYLLDPVTLLDVSEPCPIIMITGKQDLIQKDTLKLSMALEEKGTKTMLMNFPKGKERKLDHVFSVKFPKWPESRDVENGIKDFLLEEEK